MCGVMYKVWCMHMRAYTQTHTHTRIHTSHLHAYKCERARARAHTHTHTCMHAQVFVSYVGGSEDDDEWVLVSKVRAPREDVDEKLANKKRGGARPAGSGKR